MEKKVIKPFHMFIHHGNPYVINIEGMQTNPVDEITADFLVNIADQPELLLSSHMEQSLKKLELISETEDKSKKSLNIEPTPIVHIILFLTQSCNLKCIYCYGDGGEYGLGGCMEDKTAYQAVDWLLKQSGNMKKVYLGFLGGEPFLKFPLMKAIVEYAQKRVHEEGKEIEFDVTTNATLLDDEKIAFIKDHHISVMISFDGPKEIQDAQRPYTNGKGSFDSTVPKIKKLLEVLPETHGHAVITGNTDPHLVKNALQELGFKKVSMTPASKSLFTGDSSKTESARDTQRIITSLEQEAEDWIHLTKSRDSIALKSIMVTSGLYQALISLLHNSKRRHYCGAGKGLVGVSSEGNIYLCHRFVGMDEYKIGNVFNKDLEREKYQRSPTVGNTVCASCFAKYYCAGGCKHDNASSCGSYAIPSEDMCRLKCRELELAATILCRLDPDDHTFLLSEQIFTPKPCLLDF